MSLRGWIPITVALLASLITAAQFSNATLYSGPVELRALGWIQLSVAVCVLAAAAAAMASWFAKLPVARSIRTSLVPALWVLPMLIVMGLRSPWCIVVGAVIGWISSQSAYQLSSGAGLCPMAGLSPATLFAVNDDPPTNQLGSFSIALILESSVLLWALRWRRASLLLFAVVAGLLAWRFWSADPERSPAPVTWTRMTKRLAQAAFTIFSLLLPPVQLFLGGGGYGGRVVSAAGNGGPEIATATSAVYPGVIIVPEIRKRAVTLVPPIPAMRPGVFGATQTDPLSIPFWGVYWLLRRPQIEPSASAVTLHGDTSITTYRSTDRSPMTMTARQDLGNSFSLSCCSGIRVVVWNGERNPDTITVELRVRDTIGDAPAVTLGQGPLLANREWKLAADPVPVQETLRFPIPSGAARNRFDQLVVVFHLGTPREHRSARVAVDRFTLVPRGRAL
jgi:hypothetical protein